jgi:hypothetical protein
MLGYRLSVIGRLCGLIFWMALPFHANAQTQCSFNQDLYFDPELFPNLPSGYDANKYPSEDAALSAAKRASRVRQFQAQKIVQP